MLWFKKKQQPEGLQLSTSPDSRVEIELHKDATKEAKQKADEINAHFKDLVLENNFTVKIFVAAGGHLPAKTQKSGK